MKVMVQCKKYISFYLWIDFKDYDKGFKLNFLMVIYIEVGCIFEGYKQVEFVVLKSLELVLDYDYF